MIYDRSQRMQFLFFRRQDDMGLLLERNLFDIIHEVVVR